VGLGVTMPYACYMLTKYLDLDDFVRENSAWTGSTLTEDKSSLYYLGDRGGMGREHCK
jgi:hypothetical protein